MQRQTRGALFITRRCLVYGGWKLDGCPGSVSSFNLGNVSPSSVTRSSAWPDTGTAPVRVTTSLSRFCLGWGIILCILTSPHLHNTWYRYRGLYLIWTKYSVHFMRGPSSICRYLPNIIWFILSLRLKTHRRTDCNTHNAQCRGCTCTVTK